MSRLAPALLLFAIALVAGAQENAPETDDDAEPTARDLDEAEAELQQELEDESYIDAEQEDFRPSEDIPLDQSIAFPTDI